MTELALYHSPGACSTVPHLILLQKAQADYELRIVRGFSAGENRAESFQKVNPKGKVPVLVRNGDPLTENVAICGYLAQQFRQRAPCCPIRSMSWGYAHVLSWPVLGHEHAASAGGPHALAAADRRRRAGAGQRQEDGRRGNAEVAATMPDANWPAAAGWQATPRIACDVVSLHWAATRAAEAGVDMMSVPNVAALVARLKADPVVVQALARESTAVAALPPAAPAQ